jgi:IclR family transcriptional regulator, acetate operon repressor
MTAGTSVVRRAFQVLGAFDARSSRLTLSQLVAHTGLPKTTVHRVALELVALGALERRNGGYALGSRLFELGQRVPRHRRLRDAALPYMHDLYALTRETVQLAVLEDLEVLYVEILHGRGRIGVASRGSRMPFHCTALGKAMVAFSSREVVAHALETRLAPRTPRTIVDPNALRRELARTRRAGVAYDRGECERRLVCAAAPITNADGLAIAAVAVSLSHRSHARLDRLGTAVARAAGAISDDLGAAIRAPQPSDRAMAVRARANAPRSPYS